MCTRDVAGAPPSPFPQGALTTFASGLSPDCRLFQAGATRMRFLSHEGVAQAHPLHRTGDPQTFRKSFRCAFVCALTQGSAAPCKVHSPGCTEGRRGAPAALQSPCLCDCFVCARFDPSSCMSPPSPIWLLFREFVSSPAIRFGLLFPRGGGKEVGLVTAPHPRGKREIKPPQSGPASPAGAGGGAQEVIVLPRESENRAVHGVCTAVWAWGGSDWCPWCVSGSPLRPRRTVSLSTSPGFPGAEAVSLSF